MGLEVGFLYTHIIAVAPVIYANPINPFASEVSTYKMTSWNTAQEIIQIIKVYGKYLPIIYFSKEKYLTITIFVRP